MRAVRFHGVQTGLTVDEVPRPDPGEGEVVIDVAACGLCGSDVHFLDGMPVPGPLPVTFGHEPSGTITAIGSGVTGWQIGDRVAVSVGAGCGECRTCLGGSPEACPNQKATGLHFDGAFADALVVPASALVRVPEGVSFEAAAVTTDCVASPFHALRCRARLVEGESLVVIGIGGLGSMAVACARLLGADRVVAVDRSPAALERATLAGATSVVLVPENGDTNSIIGAVREAAGGSADVAIECVGLPETAALGSWVLRPGGRLVLVGVGMATPPIPFPQALFAVGEYSVIGSFASHQEDIAEVLSLIASGRLDVDSAISHRISLEEVPAGYEMLRTHSGDPQRIVMVNR